MNVRSKNFLLISLLLLSILKIFVKTLLHLAFIKKTLKQKVLSKDN
jgi:hypothetical protein